jgi:uracil-DNA glycosylase family 4
MRDSLKRVTADVVACDRCPRLVAYRAQVAQTKRRTFRNETYWGRPVPGFGDLHARLVIVGLAPGAHGSNRTGRMFTGDSSGDTLFAALHAYGFASQPQALARDDGLRLSDCFITAAARCVPPGNRPSREELRCCQPFLLREMALMQTARVYVALGRVAYDTLRVAFEARGQDLQPAKMRFGHGNACQVGDEGLHLLCSYHPSRQNTQTGRLTTAMFRRIFSRARRIVETQRSV